MTRTIVVENLSDLAKLADLPERMRQKALEAITQQAELMVGLAQVYCPVKEGHLRDSIRMERIGDKVSVLAGGKGVEYAAVIEAKQPFMLPAWLSVYPAIKEAIESAVEEVLP